MFEQHRSSELSEFVLNDDKLLGSIEVAAAKLLAGELVVFPTDTVYGLGADPFNKLAIIRLFKAKQRPLNKGLPVLLAQVRDLEKVVVNIPEYVSVLVDRYWPGPLTMILRRKEGLPESLSPNDGVAVRVPDNDIARSFIQLAGGAVAASSANLTGRPPAGDAASAESSLAGCYSAVIDGGKTPIGQASTVIDCRVYPPRLLRAGPITAEQIFASTSKP